MFLEDAVVAFVAAVVKEANVTHMSYLVLQVSDFLFSKDIIMPSATVIHTVIYFCLLALLTQC